MLSTRKLQFAVAALLLLLAFGGHAQTLTPTSSSGCAGSTVNYTLTNTAGIISTPSWQIISGSGVLNAGSTTASVVWQTSGQVRVSFAKIVNGNPMEESRTATFSLSSSANGGTVSGVNSLCSGSGTTLTVSGTVGTITWQSCVTGCSPTSDAGWSTMPSGGTISNLTTSTSFRVKAVGACNTAYSAIKTVSVTARPTPTISAANGSVCANTPGYGYTTQTGGGISGYTWSVTGGTITSGQGTSGVSVTWTSIGTQTLSVTYSLDGCSALSPGTKSVTVNAQITPTVSIIPPTTICSGQSVSFSANSSQSITGYQWRINSGSVLSTSSVFTTNQLQNGNVVSLTVTVSGSCLSQSTASANHTANVVSINTAVTPASALEICPGGSVVLNAAGGYALYEWLRNDVSIGAPNASSYTATIAGNYKVRITHGGCTMTTATAAVVSIGASATPTFTSGPIQACVGSGGHEYITQPGMSNYVWTVTGGTITAGGNSSNHTATVTWNTVGNQTITVNYTTPTGCTGASPAAASVLVDAPASAITSVAGLKTTFVNEMTTLQVEGAADATSFTWAAPSGSTFSNSGLGVPGREVSINNSSSGSFFVNAVKNACVGPPIEVPIRVIPTKSSTITLNDIAPSHEGFVFLDKHSSAYTTGCISTLGPVTFRMKADFGEVYNLGARNFTVTINATVTAYYDLPGQSVDWPVTYTLTQNVPERMFAQTLTSNLDKLKFIGVKINSYTTSDPVAGSFVRLFGDFTELDQVQANTATVSSPSPGINASLSGNWDQTFSWSSSCSDVPNYEFQLLRVYGGETPDWSKALILYTENSSPEIRISMAEGGDGSQYFWRVRPVGNMIDANGVGGVANPMNLLSDWNAAPVWSFTYTHPEDNKNWIYSRTFTEGNNVSERITYANGLQQVSQQQTRIQGINQVVASETVQDFVGRNAVSSLPIPVAGKTSLGYVSGLLKHGETNFNASVFDNDPNLVTDAIDVSATDYSNYYSGVDQSSIDNKGVASAEGFPYSRTLFTDDGTGRIKEQSGVGRTHAMVGNDRKTVKTFYSTPDESELLRMFGREAPLAKNVQKIVTYDANGTGNATYKTKDGKVIATALVVTGSTGALTALPSRASATSTIFEEVNLNQRQDDYTAVMRKPMLFTTDNTTLTVDYEITPALLQELCVNMNQADLVGYYPFDGNMNDASGRGYNGTTLEGAYVADLLNGKAYSLDGTNDYFQIADNPDIDFGSNDFTVSFWVNKLTATPGNGDNTAGVGKWNTNASITNEWTVSLSTGANSQIPVFHIESGSSRYSVNSNTPLTIGAWTHITAIRRGDKLEIYLNGVIRGTTLLPNATLAVNDKGLSLLGGRFVTTTGSGGYTKAYFDDLTIYRRGLSAEEVGQLFQRSGPLCRTCDYTVEFFLRKADDPAFVQPGLPEPRLIQAGNCTDQASLKWDPVAFNLTGLSAGVNYVLEKQIKTRNVSTATNKTYLQEHEESIRAFYQAELDETLGSSATVNTINYFIAQNDVTGLNTYLNANFAANFDSNTQQYMIPVGTGATGCREYIFIPRLDACPNEIPDPGTCLLNTMTYEGYFEDYMTKNYPTYVLKTGTALNYAFFRNRHTASKQFFTEGQLNQMIANLIADNSGRVNCGMVWEIVVNETAAFMARGSINFSGISAEDLAAVGINTLPANGETSLYESIINAVDAKLQDLIDVPPNAQTLDLCDAGSSNPYFIKKTELYGYINGAQTGNAVTPDLAYAYRLVYFDESKEQQLNALRFYAGLDQSAPVTITNFTSLSDCNKHALSKQTQYGDQQVGDEAIESAKMINKIRSRCGEACEGRDEEFRQAVINNIMVQNSNAKIQYYSVAKTSIHTNKWVATKNMAVNVTVFDYSECAIESMVNALIANCKNYCGTALTPFTESSVKRYGTDTEWHKIKMAMLYNFEVDVNTSSQTCNSDWDNLKSTGNPTSQPGYGWNFSEALFQSGPFAKLIPDLFGNFYGISILNQNGFCVLKDNSVIQNNDIAADYVIQKFDGNGNIQWIKHIETRFIAGNSGAQGGLNYALDPATGDIVLEAIPLIPGSTSPTSLEVYIEGQLSLSYTIRETQQPSNYTGSYILKITSSGLVSWIKYNEDPDTGLTQGDGPISKSRVFVLNGFFYHMVRSWMINANSQANVSIVRRNLTTGEVDLNFVSDKIGKNSQTERILSLNGELYMQIYWQVGQLSTDIFVNDVQIASEPFVTSIRHGIFKFNSSGKFQYVRFIHDNSGFYSNVTLTEGNGSLCFLGKTSGLSNPYNVIIDGVSRVLQPEDIFLIDISETGTLTWKGTFAWLNTWSKDFVTLQDHILMASEGGNVILRYDISSNSFIEETLTEIKSPISRLHYSSIDQSTKVLTGFYTQLFPNPFGNASINFITGTPSGSLTQPTAFIAKQGPLPCDYNLCFRFTDLITPISVPVGMEDLAYDPQPESCAQASAKQLRAAIDRQVEQLLNNRVTSFREQYKTCADPSGIADKLTLTYTTGLHHFTLYYYDRAGNLQRTVPPKGVVLLPVNTAAALTAARTATPAHTLVTEYHYNSLGQLVREHSPDANNDPTAPAGEYVRPVSTSTESAMNASKYYASHIYNDKSQLRFSRNAKQKGEDTYSYTKYDELGRVIEVGEVTGYDETTLFNNRNNNSGFPGAGMKQTTSTFYTAGYPYALPNGYAQRFLRNRVSYALNDEDGDLGTVIDQTTTIYSYDTHGNVEWLVQMIPGLPAIAMRYEYDLISGKVTKVSYNPGELDQFYHKYSYDANNRITEVFTSRDGYLWEKEANYEYYLHGPLRRAEIGEDKLQGVDYTYTVHGWLKAINEPQLDKVNDPSYSKAVSDGAAGSEVGRDAFGMALSYFTGDYKHTGSPLDATQASILIPAEGKDLYNGNVAAWASRNYYTGSSNAEYVNASLNATTKNSATGFVYQYDELNRLLQSDFRYLNGGMWTASGNTYHSKNTYDANGNILGQVTYDGSAALLDNITGATAATQFNYYAGTNRLSHVPDAAATTTFQQDVEKQAANNYTYDAIGNLTKDNQNQTQITWSPYGKVMKVQKTTGGLTTEFRYDAAGNRVSKKRINGSGLAVTNYYVRDASGNIMGVYEKVEGGSQPVELSLIELPIYGSDRLGQYSQAVPIVGSEEVILEPFEFRITTNTTKNAYDASYLLNPGVTITLGAGFNYTAPTASSLEKPFSVRVSETGGMTAPADGLYSRTLNSRQYELKDHLGNVRAVTTDVKLSVVTGGVPGAFEPKVISVQNYYPFGMEQPNRSWNANAKYRYGFNGKEKDDNGEWGTANYDYGFRIYNPSIGKFLSVDPLTRSFPWYTPYQFAGNKPIWAIDLDGLEEYIYQYDVDDKLNVSLIKRIRNVELREKINPSGIPSGVYERFNKTTGERFNEFESSTVQFQYFYKGRRVGIRRDETGRFVGGENEFLTITSNWFESFYIGPHNPTLNKEADYRREALSVIDAAALQHDKDYDAVKAKGLRGALFDRATLQADIDLVQRANRVIEMYENKEVDRFTGTLVSEKTYEDAKAVSVAFSLIALSKAISTKAFVTKEDKQLQQKVRNQIKEIKRD